MPSPIIIKTTIGGESDRWVYVESDYVVTNLSSFLHRFFGKEPIVYKLYDTQYPNNWLVSGTLHPHLFIQGFNVNDLLKPKFSYIDDPYGVKAKKNDEDWAQAKRHFSNQLTLIGTDINGLGFCNNKEGSVTKDKSTLIYGTEQIRLRKRGVLTTDASGVLLSAGGGLKLYPNSPLKLVAQAWQNYSQAVGSDKQKYAIYMAIRSGINEYANGKQVTTFEELQTFYPKFAALDLWQKSGFLSDIVDANTDGPPKRFVTIFANGKWWDILPSYVGLWQEFVVKGMSVEAILEELKKRGYTDEQANTIRAISGFTAEDIAKSSDGSGASSASSSSSNSGGAVGADGKKWTGPEGYSLGAVQNITVQRSRNIFLTSDEIAETLRSQGRPVTNTSPIMYQVYQGADVLSSAPRINQYVFDLAPNEINYSGFGGEWVNIDRVGTFPFIDWKSFKLLQVSFSFVIAAKTGNVTADGMEIPITEKIEELQRMAQTPFPVMFYGFDRLLTNQFRYDVNGNPRGVQFVIQDLTISASRRNATMEITRATANLTLQEIPVERQALIGMPRLVHKPIIPDVPVTILDPEYGLTSDNLTSKPDRGVTYPAVTVP